MEKRLLISTVALLAGLGLASAQQAPGGAGGQSGSAVQKQETHGNSASQKQESRGSTMSRESRGEARGGEQGKQAQERNRNATTGQGGHEQAQQGHESKQSTTGQSKRNNEHATSQKGEQGKQAEQGKAQQGKEAEQGKAQQGKQPQGKQATEGKQPNRTTTGQGQRDQGKEAQSKQQGQQGQRGETARSGREGQTGQGQQGRNEQVGERGTNARGTVQLSNQQRTEIREKVFASSNVPRVDNVNFSLNVGTVVPTSVRVATVPDVIITYYPQWRGFDYFVVHDDIVIVDHSHKIVAMMPVGSSNAQLNGGSRGSVGVASRGGSANTSVEEIREMQEVLVREGYDVTVDGKLGPKTKEALIQFQRKNGLRATGEIDNETMVKLGINEHGSQGATTGQGRQGGNANEGRQNEGRSNAPSTAGQRGQEGNAPQGQSEEHGNTPSGQRSEQRSPAQEHGGNQPSTTGQGTQEHQGNQPSANPNAGASPSNNRRDTGR